MEIEYLSGTYAAPQLWQYWWCWFPNCNSSWTYVAVPGSNQL